MGLSISFRLWWQSGFKMFAYIELTILVKLQNKYFASQSIPSANLNQRL